MNDRRAALVFAFMLFACGGGTQASNNLVVPHDAGLDQAGGAGGSGGAPEGGNRDCNQNLTFDDPLVETAVRQGAGVPTGPLSQSDIGGITYLIVESGAQSLGGVECLQALESIAARDGTIEDLSPLRQLVKLRAVVIERNRIRDLSPLSNLPQLRMIRADDNLVQSLDGFHVVLSHECALELHLVNNSVGDAEVQPFCDLGWVVRWGGGDGGSISSCNSPCL